MLQFSFLVVLWYKMLISLARWETLKIEANDLLSNEQSLILQQQTAGVVMSRLSGELVVIPKLLGS